MKWLKLAIIPALATSLVLLTPITASAHNRGGFGPGLAVGAIVGAIAGAAIAGSANNNNYYYGRNYYYGPRYPRSCRQVVRVCRDRWGPYGNYQRCYTKVRWVC